MNRFRLEVQTAAQRSLRTLPNRLRAEASQILLDLREEPYPPDSKPLGRELRSRRRIRLNGWRIIYTVDESEQRVIVWVIRRRGPDTYLNLP